jgi:hypothetical protein
MLISDNARSAEAIRQKLRSVSVRSYAIGSSRTRTRPTCGEAKPLSERLMAAALTIFAALTRAREGPTVERKNPF